MKEKIPHIFAALIALFVLYEFINRPVPLQPVEARRIADAKLHEICTISKWKLSKWPSPVITHNEQVINSGEVIPWVFDYELKPIEEKLQLVRVYIYANGRVEAHTTEK